MNATLINADFNQRMVVPAAQAGDWVASPLAGVHRRLLHRVGGEVARATSLVRCDAGSRFERYLHGSGEEFRVLSGSFSDERGDDPAGTQVRKPPSSAHAPFSRDACTLFVKPRQFAAGARDAVWIGHLGVKLLQPPALTRVMPS